MTLLQLSEIVHKSIFNKTNFKISLNNLFIDENAKKKSMQSHIFE